MKELLEEAKGHVFKCSVKMRKKQENWKEAIMYQQSSMWKAVYR